MAFRFRMDAKGTLGWFPDTKHLLWALDIAPHDDPNDDASRVSREQAEAGCASIARRYVQPTRLMTWDGGEILAEFDSTGRKVMSR